MTSCYEFECGVVTFRALLAVSAPNCAKWVRSRCRRSDDRSGDAKLSSGVNFKQRPDVEPAHCGGGTRCEDGTSNLARAMHTHSSTLGGCDEVPSCVRARGAVVLAPERECTRRGLDAESTAASVRASARSPQAATRARRCWGWHRPKPGTDGRRIHAERNGKTCTAREARTWRLRRSARCWWNDDDGWNCGY